MIAVYVKEGAHKGKVGILFNIDGRTVDIVTKEEIVRVDKSFICPLDIVQSMDAAYALYENKGDK